MSAAFDRDALLDAFDRIGRAAVGAGTKLQIAVYGGSALMLASNFRFATEDVDVSSSKSAARLAATGCPGNRPSRRKMTGQQTGSMTRLRFISARLAQ